ncbi:MAG: hypothetical protein ACM3SY_12740 [Candidatus Omnitrophota bacterium]
MKKVSFPIFILCLILFQLSGLLWGAIPEQERTALIALYTSTGGDNWNHHAGWKLPPLHTDGFAMPGTEGTWYGVRVENDQVVQIAMYDNHLVGSIPSELGNFSSAITYLDLSYNDLRGSIPPSLGNLSGLMVLNLGSNEELSGTFPSWLSNLSHLRYLTIAGSKIAGSIPSSLGNLSDLRWLVVGGSQLSGSIPASLGNLRQLFWFGLWGGFTGNIPKELGNLENLERFQLDGRNLSGNIPKELGNLGKLTFLSIMNTGISGTIPPELGNLHNLETLTLAINNLSGEIPAELGNLTRLKELDFCMNHLSGSIPSELGNLTNLKQISGSYNSLSGSIPAELCNLSQLRELRLDHNRLSGSIPACFVNLPNIQQFFINYNCLSVTDPDVMAWLTKYEDRWNGHWQDHQDECSGRKTYKISGQVLFNGVGLSDVKMYGLPEDPVTDSKGSYTVTVDSGWSGTVTPIRKGYMFSPPSTTYDPVKSNITTNYTATFLSTLAVSSTSVSSISIGVSPADQNGNTNGITNFFRTYPTGTSVTLTAPGKVNDYLFVKWRIGATEETTSTVSVTLDANVTATAVYGLAPEISVSRQSVNLSYIIGSSTVPIETVAISRKGGGTMNWTVSSPEEPFTVTPLSGSGTGTLTISIDPTDLAVGTVHGTVYISAAGAINSPVALNLTLHVKEDTDVSPPFGEFSTPVDGSTVSGGMALTGWALADTGIAGLRLYREDGPNLVYVGDGLFIDGIRPDIEAAYPDVPGNYKAGWGYMLLTFFLPDGACTFHAIATDKLGNVRTIGIKTVTIDNAHAVTPFGAMDTPGPGETVSGKDFVNFGWALTPQPNNIPVDGSTIDVVVDGVVVGHPVYNIFRSDIAGSFPGYANTDGAMGYYYLDTTTLSDGLHTIAWTVTDSAGNCSGIGSRYFSVNNSVGRNVSRVGSASAGQHEESGDVVPEVGETVNIEISELERVELTLSDDETKRFEGYLQVGDRWKPLPVGSVLDKGNFYWQPGPGSIGDYHLIFIGKGSQGQSQRKDVVIHIKTKN